MIPCTQVRRVFPALVPWAACLLLGCHVVNIDSAAVDVNPDYLNVIGQVPLEGDVLTNQIVLFFDKPIQLPPGPDGKPQAPFTITPELKTVAPELKGELRVGPNYAALKFSAVNPTIDQVCDLVLNQALQSLDGKKLNPQMQRFSFATFVFDVRKLWLLEAGPQKTVAGMLFPVPVNLEGLKSSLTLGGSNGAPIPFTLEQGTNESTYRVVIQGAVPEDATIHLAQGLKDKTGRLALSTPRVYPFPKEQPLVFKDAKWQRLEEDEKEIALFFNHPVPSDALREHLTLTDPAAPQAAIPFEVSSPGANTAPRIVFHAALVEPLRLSIAVSQGLRSTDAALLSQPFTYVLEPPENRGGDTLERGGDTLDIEDTWWSRGGEGGHSSERSRQYARQGRGIAQTHRGHAASGQPAD